MADSRTKNTTRNIFTGLLYRIICILLPFINRTVILKVMGADYTGISTLFSSILSVLSLAELGFNSAVVYCMYKPMAEQDWEEVSYYLALIRKVYYVVGTVIFCGGICCMPFLRYLIHGAYPEDINLYVLFALYLINSGVSYYLFAYKETLLLADQRQDITNNIRSIVETVRYAVQFGCLLITKNFYAYVIIQIIGSVCSNLMIQLSTEKRYPQIVRYKTNGLKLPVELKQKTGALMLGRVCDTLRNSLDSIILSSCMGLVATTIYGNYYYIYSAVYGILLVIANALAGSVGNSISAETAHKNYTDLRNFQFLFAWISSVCTICLAVMYQPFMKLWAGEKLMLSDKDMMLFCLYFYLINMNNIRNQYVNGAGIWDKLKASYVLEAGGNLILNIILGKLWGITGILLATIITIFLFNYVMRTHILFNNYFREESEKRFSCDQLQYAAATLIAAVIVVSFQKKFFGGAVAQFVFGGLLSVIISSIVYMMMFFKTERFLYAKGMVYRILSRKL